MKIQELYDLTITVDGLNIFEEPGTVFVNAEIAEAICNPIPTCKLTMSIPLDWLDNHSIVDGTKLNFQIKNQDLLINESLNFRVYSIDKLEINQKFATVCISGLFDLYDAYSSGNKFNLYGSSSDVFTQVANNYKLKSEIDQTNDTQLWVAGENNVYQFLADTATAGWIDDTSAMIWCLDRHGILIYKNLTKLFRTRSNNIYTFTQSSKPNLYKGLYEYNRINVSIQAGYENIINGGYGGNNYYFALNDYDWKTATAKKVIAESNIININKELSQGMSNSWMAFDVGNFHENYYLAKEQNKRILSTYSTYAKINSQFYMGYRLCQIVNLEYTDSADPTNKVALTSGVFMIDAIKIKIEQNFITTALELVMQGINGTGNKQETY